ncbi:MAG: hypothetical protein IKG27_03625 [Bacilli bacterium]|nr:hypothetical protein [Bacilli bacterium]
MTQKELLYIEDAINHEKNIIKICEDTIQKIENEKLKTFLKKETNEHKKTKEKLLNKLEEKASE